jgi:hypothetical protein
MKRIFLAAAVTLAAALAVALMPGAAAGTSTSTSTTNLSCNDGTNLNLALETTALSGLTGAVNAIDAYPAGDPALTCSLRQPRTRSTTSMQTFSSSPRMFSSFRTLSSVWAPTGAGGNGGNPKHDYAVGGGQVLNGTDCSTENFALSAHVLAGTTSPAGGTFNLSCQPSIVGQGHASSLVAKIDCLDVDGPSSANFHATVTHTGGSVFTSYTEVFGAVVDSGPGPGDFIDWSAFPRKGGSCRGGVTAFTPTSHGNISVHQAA